MALMMVAPQTATPRKFFLEDGNFRTTLDYFGRSSGNGSGAEAFLIGLENRTLGAHFHPVDQFQILLGEPGSMFQRTAIPKLMLHYADAFTTYGPLIGADPPLRFLTLRAEATNVTAYMPKDRELLLYRGRRSFHVDPLSLAAATPLAPKEVVAITLIEAHDDGLGALLFTAGPGASIALPSAPDTGGQFVYVADGALWWQDELYGAESLGWLGDHDGAATVSAGPDGCRVLVLRYPSPPTTATHPETAGLAIQR